jgi:hypothetical protein
MSDDARPCRSEDVSYQHFEGENEVLLLHLVTGRYYTLNESAAAFWMLCDGTRSAREIVEQLHHEYDVDQEALTRALTDLWHELAEEGLLSEPPSGRET